MLCITKRHATSPVMSYVRQSQQIVRKSSYTRTFLNILIHYRCNAIQKMIVEDKINYSQTLRKLQVLTYNIVTSLHSDYEELCTILCNLSLLVKIMHLAII